MIAVEQSDRVAAADLMRKLATVGYNLSEYIDEIESGDYDENYAVQAFASYRLHLAGHDRGEGFREAQDDLDFVKRVLTNVFEKRGKLRDGVLASNVNIACHRLAQAQALLPALSNQPPPAPEAGLIEAASTLLALAEERMDTSPLSDEGQAMQRLRAALAHAAVGEGYAEEKPLCTYPHCGAGHPLVCRCRSGSAPQVKGE